MQAAMPRRPRILFLDAHDSFTNNITSLLTTLLNVDVHVLEIDSPLFNPGSPTFRQAFAHELSHYDAVVCGPGPGTPENPDDVGLIGRIWDFDIPVLGVCLGFQALVLASGGRVRRLEGGLHGMVRQISHSGTGIFKGVGGGFRATLYHSLCVNLGQDGVGDEEWESKKWNGEGWRGCEELVPLAWVEEPRGDGRGRERICMAVRHRSKPFWGVQYHPESVCTETEGDRVIVNWFGEAMRWNAERGRVVRHGDVLAGQATRTSLLSTVDHSPRREYVDFALHPRFRHTTISIPEGMDVVDMVELLDDSEDGHIVLDSSNASLPAPKEGAADVRGRYSIFALGRQEWVRVTYKAGNEYTLLWPPHSFRSRKPLVMPLHRYGGSIWGFLADYQNRRRVETPKDLETPFLGGFMGFVTYEQGLHDIGVEILEPRGHERPDVCFVWVAKSVVVDHRKGLVHVQHLQRQDDRRLGEDDWTGRTARMLREPPSGWKPRDKASDVTSGKADDIDNKGYSQYATHQWKLPDQDEYQDKVKQCQEYIAAGDSYELCLTDQTTISRKRSRSIGRGFDNIRHGRDGLKRPTPPPPTSWQLFKRMRASQPAPFASYIKLEGMTLVSASPERFLEYDRDGHCSMRPMKGTVRKSDSVSTLAQAEKILHVPKEEAENLMIVDLVRHDLHGVCGAGNVEVRDLMKVEEYRDVYQMITVVEGRLPPPEKQKMNERYTGLDVLAASLPPGSMTGAPKKRSCEILRTLEGGRERSVYSGVVGYMCASGRGDWSVTIRSLFRWEDEQNNDDEGGATELWRIGAGGAVTALSTPEGEAEEMFTKLDGPFRTINWDRLGWTGHGWE